MIPPLPPQPTTVALRFRDLSIGDTVAQHNEIAAEHGHVWWGWWNKPEERTPVEVFRAFDATIAASHEPIQVFLVDSGHNRLYTAALGHIHVTPGLQEDARGPSPQPGRTPAYYRNTPYRVWFRFDGQILEQDKTLIRDYSYQEVAEDLFVVDKHQDRYDGKRVESVEEMLSRRHRTIYFLRPFVQGDGRASCSSTSPTTHSRSKSSHWWPPRTTCWCSRTFTSAKPATTSLHWRRRRAPRIFSTSSKRTSIRSSPIDHQRR